MPRRGFGGRSEVRISVEIYFWDEGIDFFRVFFVFTERLFLLGKSQKGELMGYPMSAIVGKEEARLALCLMAVNPAVGGVLFIGGRGVGKSVLARGLKHFCVEPWLKTDWTELPVYINPEQMTGKYGILERAQSSWLYIDEINLLSEQAGRILSVEVDCRGMLATMDPEEGSLPEYLKERFGLTVFLEGEKESEKRMEIVRRNLEYEEAPEQFQNRWERQEQRLANQIQMAQKRLRQVRVTESACAAAAEMIREAGCTGNRAELYLIETARALAAWENATAICASHLAHAAYFVLPGRGKKRLPGKWKGAFSEKEQNGQGECIRQDMQAPSSELPGEESGGAASTENGQAPVTTSSTGDGMADQSQMETGEGTDESREWPKMERVPDENAWLVQEERQTKHVQGKNGRRRELHISGNTGRCIRAIPGSCREFSEVALSATLLHAAAHSGGTLPLQIRETDIRRKIQEGRGGYYILFAVDASASMGGAKRLALTERTILSMLRESYEKRDKVAMTVFQGQRASLLLEFTNSPELAQKRLQAFPVKGRTPLAQGLRLSRQILLGARQKERGVFPVLVLVTDGRATAGGEDPVQEALTEARQFALAKIPCIVIDTEQGRVRLGIAGKLAKEMNGRRYQIQGNEMELSGLIQRALL